MQKTTKNLNKQRKRITQSSAQQKEGNGGVLEFVDNRPEAIAQAKLKNMNANAKAVTQ